MFNFRTVVGWTVVALLYLGSAAIVTLVAITKKGASEGLLDPIYLIVAVVALIAAIWLTIWMVGRRQLRNILLWEVNVAQNALDREDTFANQDRYSEAKFNLDQHEGKLKVSLGGWTFTQEKMSTKLKKPEGCTGASSSSAASGTTASSTSSVPASTSTPPAPLAGGTVAGGTGSTLPPAPGGTPAPI